MEDRIYKVIFETLTKHSIDCGQYMGDDEKEIPLDITREVYELFRKTMAKTERLFLLSDIDKHINFEELEFDESILDKHPEFYVGDQISVYWKDVDYEYEIPDCGYVTALPIAEDTDCGNLIIHFPVTQNNNGIGDGIETWIHLIDLLQNENIKKVEVSHRLNKF